MINDIKKILIPIIVACIISILSTLATMYTAYIRMPYENKLIYKDIGIIKDTVDRIEGAQGALTGEVQKAREDIIKLKARQGVE